MKKMQPPTVPFITLLSANIRIMSTSAVGNKKGAESLRIPIKRDKKRRLNAKICILSAKRLSGLA